MPDGVLHGAADGTQRTASRCAIVDLGSNSVRLVVFEGLGRSPLPIFNEIGRAHV